MIWSLPCTAETCAIDESLGDHWLIIAFLTRKCVLIAVIIGHSFGDGVALTKEADPKIAYWSLPVQIDAGRNRFLG